MYNKMEHSLLSMLVNQPGEVADIRAGVSLKLACHAGQVQLRPLCQPPMEHGTSGSHWKMEEYTLLSSLLISNLTQNDPTTAISAWFIVFQLLYMYVNLNVLEIR